MHIQDLRPRLVERVHARIHWVGGDATVWLVDPGRGRIAIGLREWRVLAACDGTRDLQGIVAAASTRGTRTTAAHAGAFLQQLYEAGLLVDGPPEAPSASGSGSGSEWGSGTGREPVRPLPGYRLRCDGRGSCCRYFGSTVFSPVEQLRARARAPEVLDGAVAPERLFAPLAGSVAVPWDGGAVAMVDGRCAFLEGDGGCGLHRRGGPEAKPMGCRGFPAELVGTPTEVRVTPRPECACVLRSGRRPHVDAEPLVAATVASELPAELVVRPLGDVSLAPAAARGAYLQWHATVPDSVEDVPAWLDDQADRLLGDRERADGEWRAAAERAASEETWRAPTDLVRLLPEALLAAGAPRPDPAGEAFYLRAVAFGHLWAFDGVTVAQSLRRRAAGLRLARRVRAPAGGTDPAFDEPIALVEAFGRRAGLLAAG